MRWPIWSSTYDCKRAKRWCIVWLASVGRHRCVWPIWWNIWKWHWKMPTFSSNQFGKWRRSGWGHGQINYNFLFTRFAGPKSDQILASFGIWLTMRMSSTEAPQLPWSTKNRWVRRFPMYTNPNTKPWKYSTKNIVTSNYDENRQLFSQTFSLFLLIFLRS